MSTDNSTKNTGSRLDLIQAVKTPLGFFTLVVLIVEAILGLTASFNQGSDRTYLIVGMLSLTFILVIIVALFAFFRPESLYGRRLKTKGSMDMEIEGLTPAQKIAKYQEWIATEARENLLINFNVPENYKAEISTIDKFTFGFCYPEKWTFSKLPQTYKYGLAMDPESAHELGFIRNMNIMIDDVSGMEFPTAGALQPVADESLQQVLLILPNAKLISQDKGYILQGLPASRWIIEYTSQDDNHLALTLYQVLVMDKNKKNLYTISFTTTTADFTNSQHLFDNITNTFRI